MKVKYSINVSQSEKHKIVNIEAPTIEEVQSKLLWYIINNFKLDVATILDDLAYSGYFEYNEIEDEEDHI